MNVSSGLAGAVTGAQSLQQLFSIEMLKKAESIDTQMASLIINSVQQPDPGYNFSIYV